jgi:hypothetical protein
MSYIGPFMGSTEVAYCSARVRGCARSQESSVGPHFLGGQRAAGTRIYGNGTVSAHSYLAACLDHPAHPSGNIPTSRMDQES